MKFREMIFFLLSLFLILNFQYTIGIRVIGFSDSKNSISNYQPTIVFDQTIGGTDLDYAYTVITTSDGGFALLGYTYSYGAGGSDMWFVKTDKDGVVEWEKTFGGLGLDYGFSLTPTSDGGYILTGGTESYGAGSSDFWIIKTDRHGIQQWNQTYGGSAGDYSFAIHRTSGEGYIIGGRTESFGAGGSDMWLVKINNIGEIEWNRTYGGVNSDSGDDLIVTSNDGYAIVGGTESYGAGSADMWFVKTNEFGEVEWNKTYGGVNEDRAMAVINTFDNGYVITGMTKSYGAGNRDIWMIKIDNSGQIEWNQTIGGSLSDFADSIITTFDGGYALAGRTESFGEGNEDMWLIKTTNLGQVEWNLTFGGTDGDAAYSLLESSENEYVIVGRSASQGTGDSNLRIIKVNMDLITSNITNLPLFEFYIFSIIGSYFIFKNNKRKI